MAVLAGFAGVVLIAQPKGDSWELVALLPLIAAAFIAIRDTLTRDIASTFSAIAVALVTSIAVMIAGLATLPFGWSAMTIEQAGFLAVNAFLLSMATTLVITSVRLGEVSFIAPFRYVSIVLAVIYGILFWGDIPGWHVLIGALIIVASGLYIFYRELSLNKAANRQKCRS